MIFKNGFIISVNYTNYLVILILPLNKNQCIKCKIIFSTSSKTLIEPYFWNVFYGLRSLQKNNLEFEMKTLSKKRSCGFEDKEMDPFSCPIKFTAQIYHPAIFFI